MQDEKNQAASDEDEDLSAGYLDNDDGDDENEYELNSSPSLNNISPKRQSMMTITTGNSPEVNRHKRTIKLKAPEPPTVGQSPEKIYQSNMKNSLGVSNSQKVIENKGNYQLEGSAAGSKKSIELSNSDPKENLVRHMY